MVALPCGDPRRETHKESIMNVWRAMWGFDGRISRKYFWLAGLVWTIGFFAIMFPLLHWFSGGQWLSDTISDRQLDKAGSAAMLIAAAILLYPSLAMSVKRLHDLNLSAWWCVPLFIPTFADNLLTVMNAPAMVQTGALWIDCAVALVYLVVLGFIRGTDGPNQYGDDPRAKPPAMVAMPA
jgi:uncharacterized membrane protein YhaH (DUF805 family)